MQPHQNIIYFNPNQLLEKETEAKLTDQREVSLRGKGLQKWKKENYEFIFSLIKVWKVPCLRLSQNFNKKIIKEIFHIEFLVMRKLVLEKNQIETIQCLCRIRMPKLEELWIGLNRINFISGLRKASWPQINVLGLNNTDVMDHEKIVEMDGQVKRMLFQFDSNEKVHCENIRFLAKIKGFNFEKLYIRSILRINDRNIEEELRKKYLNASFDRYKD